MRKCILFHILLPRITDLSEWMVLMKKSDGKYDLEAAHKTSTFNRNILEHDKLCGCFYCLEIFDPTEITEWIPESEDGDEVTALCPYCGVDAIIPESSGFPLTKEFLEKMNHRFF